MKKLFAGISAAVLGLGCLTACNETPSYNVNAAADFLDATYVNQIEDGRVDYVVLNTFTYGGATYTVEWSVDVTSGVVLVNNGNETKVDVDEAAAADLDYVLTATVKDPNGNTATVSFYATLLAAPSMVPFAIEAKPVEGTAYKLYTYNGDSKFDMYFNGQIASKFYLGSVEDYTQSVDVFVEYVDGSDTLFNLYFESETAGKQYFGIRQNWNATKSYWAYNPYIESTPVSQFEYSEQYGTIITTVAASSVQEEGAELDTTKVIYWGNSGKHYTTIGGLEIDDFGTDKQGYVANLVTMGSAASVSAEDKFNFEKEAVSFVESIVGATTINVSQIGKRYYDVKVAWEVEGDFISYNEGVITVTNPTAETTVTVKATVTLGELTETKTFTVTLKPAVVVPEAGSTLTIVEANELGAKFEKDSYTEGKYYVTGTVANITATDKYANVYIADESGNQFYIYGIVDPDTGKFENIETLPQVGDTITVYGVIGCYNSAQMKNGQLVELVPGAGEVPEYTVMTIAEALVAADNTMVQVSGTVCTVNSGWNASFGNMNVTITDESGNELYLYRLATQVALGDIITVKGTMATYNNARQVAQGATAEITGHDNSYDYVELTIAEANAAADGTNVIVSGTVSVVDKEWDSYYKNMNVTITDGNGNTLYVYRVGTQVALGDIITVKGALTTYNDVKQIGQGGTATITGHDDSYDTPAGGNNSGSGDSSEGGSTTDPELPDTPEYAPMSISEALVAAVDTKVELSGTVSEIYQKWNASYGNMSVYITDGTARILVFRTTVELGIGDVITVKGVITTYNEVNQIAAGSTVEITQAHTCTTYTEATCQAPETCTVCGEAKVGSTVVDCVYVDGACKWCSAPEGVATITASKTMAELITANGWTNTTTKQSFNLDDVVSVQVNGGSNTGKAYDGDHIRIYATDSPAGTLTISLAEGYELVSIKITTKTGTYAYLYVDGTTTDICNQTVAVSGSSVVLNSVKNGSNGKQVRVTGIEVVYKATTPAA